MHASTATPSWRHAWHLWKLALQHLPLAGSPAQVPVCPELAGIVALWVTSRVSAPSWQRMRPSLPPPRQKGRSSRRSPWSNSGTLWFTSLPLLRSFAPTPMPFSARWSRKQGTPRQSAGRIGLLQRKRRRQGRPRRKRVPPPPQRRQLTLTAMRQMVTTLCGRCNPHRLCGVRHGGLRHGVSQAGSVLFWRKLTLTLSVIPQEQRKFPSCLRRVSPPRATPANPPPLPVRMRTSPALWASRPLTATKIVTAPVRRIAQLNCQWWSLMRSPLTPRIAMPQMRMLWAAAPIVQCTTRHATHTPHTKRCGVVPQPAGSIPLHTNILDVQPSPRLPRGSDPSQHAASSLRSCCASWWWAFGTVASRMWGNISQAALQLRCGSGMPQPH